MLKLWGLFVAVLLGVFAVTTAPGIAADRGTPEEAKALALKAAEYLRANGPEKAFPVFSNPTGEFRDRDLYVLVLDRAAVMMAHGANPNLIGRSQLAMRDVTGKPMAAEMVAIPTEGVVEYRWQNPETKAIEEKVTYIFRVGDYTVGVGAYKPR